MKKIETNDIKEIIEIALDRDLEEFSMRSDFYEIYGMDSLGAVALVVEIQKRYDVRIPDEKMPEIRTGEQLKSTVQTLLEAEYKKEGVV